jgi:hypothetical protein
VSKHLSIIEATGRFHDAAILVAEVEHIEKRSSVIPGSSAHVKINNPIDGGIDGG